MNNGQNPGRTLWEVFNDYLKNRPLKPKTHTSYTATVRRCFDDWLYMPLSDITGTMVHQKHQQLSLAGKAQADLAMRILRAVYRFAMAYYELPNGEPEFTKNPTSKLSGLRAWHGLKRRQGRIAPAQIPTWWEAVSRLPDGPRDLLRLLFFTGMRKTEASRLKWSDVDFELGSITLRNTKNHKDHVLPLSTYTLEMLRCRLQHSQEIYVFPGSFTNSHISDFDRSYQIVVEATGIQFTPHDLRRGFMSTAAELGLQVYTIKKILNHSSQDVTYGYYVADIEKLRQEVQKVNDELVRQIYGQPQVA